MWLSSNSRIVESEGQWLLENGRPISWTTPMGLTLTIENEDDWKFYNQTFVDKLFDPSIERALNSGDPTFVDFGSNGGFFSLRIVELAKRRNVLDLTITFSNEKCNLEKRIHAITGAGFRGRQINKTEKATSFHFQSDQS